jgi:signal-transduction protein with cAMP-binding, CBS, and nucleotidyltransferase domain
MGIDNVIKGHDLFQSLTVDETHRVSDFSSIKKYQPDEFIFKYGSAGSHIYTLMNGTVYLRLPSTPPEFSFIISKIEKGELFGLSPLLDSPRYTASAQCMEETEVLAIEAQPFREMLINNCPVGYDIVNRVAHIYFARYIEVLKSIQGVLGQISLIR